MLPDEAIVEFKELYREHFGVELSDVEARIKAHALFNFVKAVYGLPIDPPYTDRGDERTYQQ